MENPWMRDCCEAYRMSGEIKIVPLAGRRRCAILSVYEVNKMRFAQHLFLCTVLSASLLVDHPAPAIAKDDVLQLRKALAKQPFKDLPGVRLPQKFDDPPQTACSSYISRDYWALAQTKSAYVPRLTRRIYRCDVNNVVIESTRQPDEIDWKKQKRYYKPWIDDGFDRDR
jgi:hypothetical protein